MLIKEIDTYVLIWSICSIMYPSPMAINSVDFFTAIVLHAPADHELDLFTNKEFVRW